MKTMFCTENSVNPVSKLDLKKRMLEDPDFIKCLGYGNSLNKYLAENRNDLENSTIARLLMLTEEEVENIYQECIDKLKVGMVESEE